MTADARAASGEIRPLTSLRGIAAMAVVMQHFSATFQAHSAGWMPSLVPHGYMAVDFFFVLSGFIMSYTYLASFEAEGMRAFGPFLMKRVARIAPLGVFTTCVVLLLGGVASFWDRSDLFINRSVVEAGLGTATLVNLLHLQGILPQFNLNGPSWSVSVELFAYLLFPALIAVVFRGGAVLRTLFLLGLPLLWWAAWSRLAGTGRVEAVVFDLGRCVVEFSFGMWAFAAFRSQGRLAFLGRDGWTWAVSAASVAALFLRQDLAAALSFPVLVLAWAQNTGTARRVMSARPVYFLGTISFSIYLVHQLFRGPELALAQAIWPAPVSPVAGCALALLGSLSVIPFAAATYRLVERPGRDAVKAATWRWHAAAARPLGTR